ncbi:hypothetical protein EDF42_3386 [Curtobacterium sp. PhB172]|uniref:hypothetical protein n=1 Tax=Curtobacterium sp. PhB172 TaxID=2485196 RepID=UPI000F4CAB49|nr:hypothetical protein [Curtobacterium sp. PhB172]ROS60005.1 hypothetical protein EDF42_3386 [Curtobacterium sp. PhB172]
MSDSTKIVDALFNYRVTDEARYQQYLDKVLPVTEKDEPYVLSYQIFRGADGSLYQHEVCEDEAAIVKHMTLTASGQEDFAASTEFISTTMLGPVSDEFRAQYGIDTEFLPFKTVTR